MTMSSGMFEISSMANGQRTVSINLIRTAWQRVYLGGPVTSWAVRKVDDKVFSLAIGGYPYTGILDGNLVATIFADQDQDWRIQYQDSQNAYTIASSSDPSRVWTLSDLDPSTSEISLKPLVSTKSMPPQILSSQLWRLKSAID
ncbi:I66 family serine proteinase inhibitor [Nocardia sp. NPDC101769]|uniref:I66 family serine proteinase inhibitor n=1 Tax=Nocardia sp. NPDC101769 TaxID=3364333 RepID=UPI0038278996